MNRKYLRKLLIIAVPIIVSNVISQIQMIIDRIFLGQMNTLYMSALGNVNSPVWMTMSCCFSIVMGSSILISQSVGASDNEKVSSFASSMLKWNNVVPAMLFFFWFFCGEFVFRAMGVSESVMPMCIGYTKYFAPIFLILGIESSFNVIMQTSNYTKPLIFYGAIRAGLNVILDYIMIFGRWGFPEMGIEGAALATTISEYAGFLFALFVVVKSRHLETRPSFLSVIKAPLKPFFNSVKLGVNVALEDFSWNFGNLMLIRILNSINELAAGIYSIVFSVEVLVVVVIGSIGNGTMTLSGEARGNKNVAQFKEVCKIAYLLCAAVSVVMLVICSLFSQAILSLFTRNEEIITTCGIYLVLVCVNLFGKAGNIIIGNGIRGSGNTKWMFITQILGTVLVISLACLFVFGFKLGIMGVFLAVIADEILRAFINLYKLVSITKHWD